MLTISTRPIIITGSRTFQAKLAKSDFDHIEPSYIITKCNGKYAYRTYEENDLYDISINLSKTINFVKFYVKSSTRRRLLHKKIIIYLNLSIPNFYRFWEKKSISIKPESLLIMTNRNRLEFRLTHKDKSNEQKKVLISVGKTRKIYDTHDHNSDIAVNIGKGFKLIKLFSIDSDSNKTFIAFRLAIRNKFLSDPKLHPSHFNSFSKWNNIYSKINKKVNIPVSDLKYAIIIDATNCTCKQVKDCMELYSNQIHKNFKIILFSKCNDIKKHFYDFKIKFVHCRHDFRLEWRKIEKKFLREYEFSFWTNAKTKIPQDFFVAINERLNGKAYDFVYFDSIYSKGDDSSYEFRHNFDKIYALQRNCIGSSYLIKSSLLEHNEEFDPHSLSDTYRYFISEKALIQAGRICHLPLILHELKRFNCEYTSDKINFAELKSIHELNLQFQDNRGAIALEPKLPSTLPLISLVVPSAGNLDYLLPFLDSLFKRTAYKNLELILTIEEDNFKRVKSKVHLDELQLPNTVIVRHKFKVFNYSKIINNALTHCQGEYICLLNDDLVFTNPTWLSEMLRWLDFDNSGIVGALLLYPDRKIQHAGITLGINGLCEHAEKGFNSLRCPKTHHLTKYAHSVTAVTGACLLARKNTFDQLNGLDEKFAEAYNDVDFCLRARAIGMNVVLSTKSKIYHHESVNVGTPLARERISTFQKEISLFLKRYAELTKKDNFYSINLSRETPHLELAYPPNNEFHWRENIPRIAPDRVPINEWSMQLPLNLDKVCIFSHFDPDGIVDDHVIAYLNSIRKYDWSIVFVTSCGTLMKKERDKLIPLASAVIGTQGEGRDWGNYSIGYSRTRKRGVVKNLLLANDSVYGPIGDLGDFFKYSENSEKDMIGMTNSHQYGNHLQSYFILCKEKLCTHTLFDHFWSNFYYQSEKDEIIYKNEIGFSLFFNRYGFKSAALYDYEDLKSDTIENKKPGYHLLVKEMHVNPTHQFIHLLLDKYNFPFVKIELLKINPSNIKNIDEVIDHIKSSNHDLEKNIKKHLKRCA